MFRRAHIEVPGWVAQTDGNRVPFGLSVAARSLFASRGVEPRPRGPEPVRGLLPRRRPSTPVLRAYAQGERVADIAARHFQRADGLGRHCRKKQRGIATVEFAIAVPVLLLLMLAAAELGRAIYQYNTLTKAVRDGARYLSMEALKGTTGVMKVGDEWEDVADKTKNVVVYGNPEGAGDPADPRGPILECKDGELPTVDAEALDAIHVEVRVTDCVYDSIFLSGIPTFRFGDGNIRIAPNMTPSATMRAL